MNPNNALQAAIYSRLSNYSLLTALLGTAKVYDFVPQGTSPPYVLIGDDTMVEADTMTGNGWDCTLTIHCWDYVKAGRKSVKSIMSAVYDALHKQEDSLAVNGFSLTFIYCEFEQSFQDFSEEGATDHFYHGVQRFRALISTINS